MTMKGPPEHYLEYACNFANVYYKVLKNLVEDTPLDVIDSVCEELFLDSLEDNYGEYVAELVHSVLCTKNDNFLRLLETIKDEGEQGRQKFHDWCMKMKKLKQKQKDQLNFI